MAKKLEYNRAAHLRQIVRNLLVCIENRVDAINSINNNEKNEIENLQKANDLLFGNKLSIAANLGQVVDLLIKMGDDLSYYTDDDLSDDRIRDLDEHDIALVKDFVRRQKAASAKAE